MEAQTLNCPMCGAPAASDATKCGHCGARLATVACPSCFGMIFQGAKFCSHCGTRVDRTELAGADRELCPRCKVGMDPVQVGTTTLRECRKCEGIWVRTEMLKEICESREQQSAVLGMAGPLPPEDPGRIEKIRYRPCPVCGNLMNRVNFANCSHVIVDVCRTHGTWFDKDELRRIVEFIRSGGMEQARAREIRLLEEQRKRLQAAQIQATSGSGNMGMGANYGYDFGDRHLGVSFAANMLARLFGF